MIQLWCCLRAVVLSAVALPMAIRAAPAPAPDGAAAAIAPAAVAGRIAECRMGELEILVRDAAGRPVPGVRVQVRQVRHAFLFGCNVFELRPGDASPAQQQYRERFAALFNYATLPFYWGSFEHERGQPQYARLDAMAQWCMAHGLVPKGHPLIWHQTWPRWAPAEPDAAIPLLERRVKDIVTHYRGQIRYWDVLNEANNADQHAGTGVGAWIVRDGAAPVVARALGWAREAGQGATNTMLYNDFNTGPENVKLLGRLQEMNALPDAIGLQSHMHGGPWPLEQVWKTAERFKVFGRPLHFTEVTVISGPPRKRKGDFGFERDWLTTPEDEAKQAEYVEQFYTLLFSHPSVQAITWWDFSDRGAWQGAPAGFLRKDMSPKPVYDRLLKRIRQDWWTRAEAVTDSTRHVKLRAFYGDHEVTVQGPHGPLVRVVALPAGSGRQACAITMPAP